MSDPTLDRGPNHAQPSPWGALLRVMTEPTATFQALAERPAIFPAYLFQTVAGLIGLFLLLPLTKASFAEQLVKTPLPPGMSAQLLELIGIGAIGLGVLVGPWLGGAIVALIASFFAQFQGGSVGFRRYFSMAGYAGILPAIGALILSALKTTAPTLQQAQSMSLSLAALAPQDSSVAVKAFLSTLDPFGLCYYALLAIGFAALQRTKPTKSAALVGTLYIVGFAFTLIGLAYSKSRGM